MIYSFINDIYSSFMFSELSDAGILDILLFLIVIACSLLFIILLVLIIGIAIYDFLDLINGKEISLNAKILDKKRKKETVRSSYYNVVLKMPTVRYRTIIHNQLKVSFQYKGKERKRTINIDDEKLYKKLNINDQIKIDTTIGHYSKLLLIEYSDISLI